MKGFETQRWVLYLKYTGENCNRIHSFSLHVYSFSYFNDPDIYETSE